MELGNFFKKQASDLPEHYWSLVIGKSWVEAGIWRVIGDKTEVITEGAGSSWQEDDEQTLIQAADSTLSAAVGSFGEEAKEPNKVVFGLPPSWVEGGSIKKEKLELLKKLSQELELSPAGFVIIPEAIVYYLKTKEGAPSNIILVGVLEDQIDVSLVQNGKIQKTVEVSRSMSLGADLAEGLARFSDLKQYPSRIVLYNHKTADLEEARQNLLGTDWKEAGINFLHTPKVEILEENVAVPAVSLAGGSEVGQATTVESAQEELKQVNLEELGFLKGKDIAQEEPQITQPTEVVEEPRLSFPGFRGNRSVLILVLVVFFFLFVAGSLAYWYLPRANVTVYVAPKRLEKEIGLTVDPQATVVNQEKSVLPGKFAQESVSGERTKQATGSKTVGDKAKGEATLYRVGPSLRVPTGTVLASSNSLKFTLDEEAIVATGSSAANPSQTKAAVTATDIGAQYNLASGTEFSVGNFSQYDLIAKNESALSGGSSREITAVSEEDRKGLEQELLAELKDQGIERLKNKLGENELLVDSTAEFVSNDKNFSHKVGEETSTLKLNLEGKVKALVVPKEELNLLLMTKLESEVSQGYLLRPEQIQVNFKEEEDEGVFKVHVVANLLPQVNPDQIARTVAGKYPDVAKNYLSTIPGFTRAQIDLSVRLPGKLRTMPRIAKNITVEVAAER